MQIYYILRKNPNLDIFIRKKNCIKMSKELLKENIKRMVRETLQEEVLRQHIRQMVKEELENNGRQGQRQYVMKTLSDNNNDKYDHAHLAYELWPDMDRDTARSYFSKCVRGERNFTNDDIASLFSLIRSKK